MSLTLSNDELLRDRNLIGARWQTAREARRLGVTNPASGSVFAHVQDSDAADAHDAVDAACAAFPGWRKRSAGERARLLGRWHDLIIEHQEDLARLISTEQGKPLHESRAEVLYGASYVAWFSQEATRIYGDIVPAPSQGKRLLVLKEPVGVVAAITPWNFPLAMIARKVAPALAAGCTVVAKPAEDTPLTALALTYLAEQAGIPAGVLNMLTASRDRTPDVVGAWLADGRVRKITFTGSTQVGKILARESAATLKKLSLELGGNAPFLVFDDADLDAAVEGLIVSKFRNGGQTCVCPNRIYVQAGVHDDFVQRLSKRVQSLPVGPANDTRTMIGPMINVRALQKVQRHVQDAVAKGARIVTGGKRVRLDDGPAYFAPTVLEGATTAMALAHEETFGPVAPVFRFKTEDQVMRDANDTPFGLAAYFYSSDVRRIWRVAEALETGIVGINEGAISSEAAPFGGVKESGYGREGSRHGLDDYLHIKYLCQGQLD